VEKSAAPAAENSDAGVLARLASDFFAALPGVVSVKDAPNAPAFAGESAESPFELSSLVKAMSGALPDELLQALRGPSPAANSSASPQAPYFLELARYSPEQPAMPPQPGPSPSLNHSPVRGVEAPSADGNSVAPNPAASSHASATVADSHYYFLPENLDSVAPLIPSRLPVNPDFEFPQIPGLENIPAEPKNLATPTAPETRPPNVTTETASPVLGALPKPEQLESDLVTPTTPALAHPTPEHFMFPGIPSFQSIPGNWGAASSEATGADLKSVATSIPGSSPIGAFIPDEARNFSLPYFLTPEAKQPAPTAPAPEANAFQLAPGMLPELNVKAGFFDPRVVRRDFPILQERVHGRPLIWLDNGATTQKPNAVIDRLSTYYRHENSNVHRAAHTLAARSTDAYEGAREKVRRFLNAGSTREIVFVRGTTEGVNLVAKSWGARNVSEGDEIVITWLEHHANIVPWQQLCEAKGAKLRVAPVDDSGQVKLDEYEKLLNSRTKIVAFSHVSNALGTITPAQEMVRMARRYGARVLIDGAQSVAHMREDMQALDCDFFVFSGHKVFAPTGIGVVYGRADLLDNTPPWQGGGNMIADVTFEKTTYNAAPARFEAGTGSIADAVGLGAALDYLSEVGIENVNRYEHELLRYATAGILTVPGLRLIGTAKEKAGVLSFVLDGVQTEDVGKALDAEGIAVRAGHHCAQPILRRFGVETTVRATLAMYNTCEDVDALVNALHRIQGASGRRGVSLQGA
jgi:cysteine desulfurase/selenocysteine lyase